MGELQVAQDACTEPEADLFSLPAGSAMTRVDRVIYTANRPIAYLVDRLPAGYLPITDLQQGFTGSVLDLLLQRGSPRLTSSRTEINAVCATPEVARALQVQRDDVLLHFEAKLYTSKGRVVDHSLSYFLPGYFRFHVVRRVGDHSA
jgi:GntR family transcriptional regulator